MISSTDIASYVDDHRDELIQLITNLVAFRTDSQTQGNPEFPKEAERCQQYLVNQLQTIGMQVQTWKMDDHYPVTVGQLKGSGGGPAIALNGHVDVVPAGDPKAWSSDPWTANVRDDRVYGRGVADMKAGVGSLIFAVRALRACGLEPRGDIWLHLVSDEEVVGFSTRQLLRRFPLPSAVIVAEPTGLDVIPVEGGLVHLRIEVEGIETHAGNRYTLIHPGHEIRGVSAIEKGVKILTALQELERQWAHKPAHPLLPPGFNTLLPSIIMGGPGGGHDGRLNLLSNAGTVSNYCSLEYNIWYLPYETFDQVREEIEKYLFHVCQLDPWLSQHPPRLTWKLNNIFFPPVDTSPDHPLIGALSRALRSLGCEPKVTGFTAASELAWYAEQGVHGVIFGPGQIAQAHSPNEFASIDEILTATKAIALTVASFVDVPIAERYET